MMRAPLADRRRDLHHLLLRDRSARRAGGPTSSSRPDLGEHRARASAHRAAVHEPASPRQRAETQILGDGQVLAERELLVHHAHAGASASRGLSKRTSLAVDEQRARRRARRCRRGSFRACSCPRRSRRRARDTTRRRSSSETSLSACTPGNRLVMCSKRTDGLRSLSVTATSSYFEILRVRRR